MNGVGAPGAESKVKIPLICAAGAPGTESKVKIPLISLYGGIPAASQVEKGHLNFSKIKKSRGLGGKRELNSALFLYLGRMWGN
ncbi:hypothetical protein AMQ84_00655 [Paenibacillus riograndensis]|uniref:Uncharacterized protein n=1 Tax=Paenibacillus riograndensis TaxID=483937 RepID=A0A132UCL5_9BACL|nr:hypothetical protein AMQ84_00655 [Paenibacillus riograndensis]